MDAWYTTVAIREVVQRTITEAASGRASRRRERREYRVVWHAPTGWAEAVTCPQIFRKAHHQIFRRKSSGDMLS